MSLRITFVFSIFRLCLIPFLNHIDRDLVLSLKLCSLIFNSDVSVMFDMYGFVTADIDFSFNLVGFRNNYEHPYVVSTSA